MSHIKIDDVRDYILDRCAEDNQLYLDVVFSGDEIQNAMKRAAREYNSVPPLISTVHWEHLDDSTNLFLDAIVAHLYISRISQLQRNDIKHDVGGVSVDLEQRQIEYMTKMIPFFLDRFKEATHARKLTANLRAAYGRIG